MSRLIDADAILKLIPYEDICSRYVIANAPTIDAVEVVRCMDCNHLKLTGGNESTGEGIYTCDVWERRTFNGTGFCSYAERRSDDSD